MLGGARLRGALLLLLFAGALALRLPDLGNRPMHADESVHAVKFHDLWKQGVYKYDPDEYHGPTIYYAALPSAELNGRQGFGDLRESDLRLVIALFGAALLLLLALAADGLGWTAVLSAAALLAASPAFVFYSRYYIQEMFLAFFTLGAIVAGWRTAHSRKPGWAILTGVFAGLAIATKETMVLTFAAAAVGLLLARLGKRNRSDVEPPDQAVGRAPSAGRLWLLGTVAALAVAVLFLSSFLTNLAGPVDYLRSYTPWITRAHGTDLHKHPWPFYFRILGWTRGPQGQIWSEALILGLAALGVVVAALPGRFRVPDEQRPFVRFVAGFTVALTLIYTLIPYKTPWNVLSFLIGMALLAGIAVAGVLRVLSSVPARAAVLLLFAAGCGQLAWQGYRAAFVYPVGGGNPYSYAQTLPYVIETAKRVEEIAAVHPQGLQMPMGVIATDGYYWPLPWYLRRLPNVGYWTEIPAGKPLTIMISSSDLDEALTEKLQPTHIMTGFFGMRSGVSYLMWVDFDLWSKYLEKRGPAKQE